MIDKIDYQGESIRLARSYATFEEYRDDPHNLPESEIPRVAGLVKHAVIPAQHSTRQALEDYLFNTIMFPGYGLSLLQLNKPVALSALEVPQMAEDRWIAAVSHGGHWLVIDDFVWPMADGAINRAEYDGARLRYYDGAGTLLRER